MGDGLARAPCAARIGRRIRSVVARFSRPRSASAVCALITACLYAIVPAPWTARSLAGEDGGTDTMGMSVSGNQLLRDGAPFLAHGFNFIGLLAPDGCATPSTMALAARSSFGSAELTAARASGANTVRFQVSQRGLDPLDSMYRDSYLTRIVNGVALARSFGFTVILSMQDQSQGCGTTHPLPSDATVRAWQTLAPAYAADPYVMFELFNEPQDPDTPDGWAQWLDGGAEPLANQGSPIIGFGQLVHVLRATGATNVLIADGANYAERLDGVPAVPDSLSPSQIVYGWHPYYFHLSNTSTRAVDQANWDWRTAAALARGPVIATEWNATVTACYAGQAMRAPEFHEYMATHGIGMLGHAFDVPGTMVTDLSTWTPTSLAGLGCKSNRSDGGEILRNRFLSMQPSSPTVAWTSDLSTTLTGTITLTAVVSDPLDVAQVRLYVDGVASNLAIPPSSAVSANWDSSAVPPGEHNLQLVVTDVAGNLGETPVAGVVVSNPDSQAPSTPTALSATLVSGGVRLTWRRATDSVGVKNYAIFRNGVPLATVGGTSYSDTTTRQGQTYSYAVAARDAAGNQSAKSTAVVAKVPDTTPPSVPGSLKAGAGTGRVKLTWSASSDNVKVAGYYLFRNSAQIGFVTGLSFVDGAVRTGTRYSYTVRAADTAGNRSAASAVVTGMPR